MSGKKLIRTVPENFDHKKTVNPKQANNLKAQQHRVANVALDSGAVATLPQFEQPVERRGPFDMGIMATWILYLILGFLAICSLVGMIISILALTSNFAGSSSSSTQALKFFGVVLTSTVFTSSCLLLSCFCIQHAKEVNWIPNPDGPGQGDLDMAMAQNAKISALYSIDPAAQRARLNLPPTPVSPSHVPIKPGSAQPLIMY